MNISAEHGDGRLSLRNTKLGVVVLHEAKIDLCSEAPNVCDPLPIHVFIKQLTRGAIAYCWHFQVFQNHEGRTEVVRLPHQ